MSIKDIFCDQNKGPDYFREEEDRICDELCLEKNQVVSFGGGTIVNNYQKFTNNSLIVCLYAPFEHIYSRIKNSKKRPLVSDERKLRHLFNERQEFYNKSDLMINVECFNAKQSAEIIKCAFETIK